MPLKVREGRTHTQSNCRPYPFVTAVHLLDPIKGGARGALKGQDHNKHNNDSHTHSAHSSPNSSTLRDLRHRLSLAIL